VWSRVRTAVMPNVTPSPSGYVAYRTLIPATEAGILAASDVGAWLASGAHVVHYPVHGGRSINVVVIVTDTWQSDAWSAPADASDVARATQSFAQDLQQALKAAPSWHKWSLAAPMRLDTWVSGRIALLGDAAHPVLPFLAQGGAMALEDAVQLAASIASSGDELPAGLVHYAATRRERVARVQATATRNGQIFHLSGTMAAARNLTLRTLPAHTAITRLNWLYGFEGPNWLALEKQHRLKGK
jgi:salicylate hydroxylase